MKNTQQHFFVYLRTVAAVLLLTCIAFKATVIAIKITSIVKNELLATSEEASNDAKAKTNFEKEYIYSGHIYTQRLESVTSITHYTAYFINYRSGYYRKITIPPPDDIVLHVA